jgi:cytochrome c oxidase subunit 4
MQALRLARSSALKSAAQRRCLTTATANHVDAAASSSTATSSRVAPIPLSNIEAQWARMTNDEKASVHEQLELVQQKDWKTLSLDEKKAGECRVGFWVACCCSVGGRRGGLPCGVVARAVGCALCC